MCDEAVQTFVRTEGEWRHFQEYLILQQSQPEIEDVEFRGIEGARATGEVLRTLELAEVIVIGPSNPVASIGPILAVPGVRAALERADVPVVAVSPLVGGRSLKGPTEKFMRFAGLEVSDGGIARHYAGLCQGLVVDRSSSVGTPSLSGAIVHATDSLMAEPAGRAHLASETLDFARSLAG
jgi:LPPG:FO 2-phospho-L-lactate transferase